MTTQEIEAWLARSLEDRRLSRNERQALAEMVGSLGPDANRREVLHRAFEAARNALAHADDRVVLDWLEGVAKALRDDAPSPAGGRRDQAEAHFSPGDDCPHAIRRVLSGARTSADVCVFTITDDRLADALIDAHRRGVAVRVLTDDDKAGDLGSDIDRLGREGLAVRVDRSPFHMHHKFAVVDGATLLTGSYNWTRGAARDNEENLIVTGDPRLVSAFAARFGRLWTSLEP